MSSKKITDADKLEIARLYREAGDTTASLASRYGVSNSTISRLLKTSIPEAEYETLIQQKRGSKVGLEEESLATMAEPSEVTPTAISPQPQIEHPVSQVDESSTANLAAVVPTPDSPTTYFADGASQQDDKSATTDLEVAPPMVTDPEPVEPERTSPPTDTEEDSNSNHSRRVRRRSSAPVTRQQQEPAVTSSPPASVPTATSTEPPTKSADIPTPDNSPRLLVEPPIPRTPGLQAILSDSKDRYSKPPTPVILAEIEAEDSDEDSDAEPEDVNALAAMFGEEISDNEDEEFAEEDWDEEPESIEQQPQQNQFLSADLLHLQVTPLSKATLPRTCYIVIDKFAELIVRPLKDFADLGQIAGEEIQQRTLPVFDNHRVAKRFSNQRTQRVIKVPDSRVFHKTTQHLRSKGITCLLVDGNIYSLN